VEGLSPNAYLVGFCWDARHSTRKGGTEAGAPPLLF